ncbi:hypothetical protein C6Y62_07840 [Hyphomicrobium sulfonivorans]|nr:hypothetical protein [Hyphomicrobium sulfonivorans]
MLRASWSMWGMRGPWQNAGLPTRHHTVIPTQVGNHVSFRTCDLVQVRQGAASTNTRVAL